ncbi:TIGR02186 family protein [Sphingomonas sp. ID0503]|uniref:TIGR02186 family protein n=1 Tax=Sphingomonas sp. ID0503 TaxID=3399691 RepID=UPI003AFB3E67
MRRAALLLAAPLLIGASQPVLVPDVSQREIRIIYSFTGAELLLFGAILYPGGRTPTGTIDIAVVVKGPAEPVVVRQKEKVAGIWMNTESTRFLSAPAFYAVASSRPIRDIVDRRTAAIYELGLDSLQLSPAAGQAPEAQRRFDDGFVDLRRRHGLYSERSEGVEMTEGVLYRARIDIPARVPVGAYTAETFLIQDGKVIAGAIRDIDIDKQGFERFVAMAADRWSAAYGAAAVALSLLMGWIAARAFRRRR